MAILKNTSITDGGFIQLPVTSTFTRLASPVTGNIYYDTTYAALGTRQYGFYWNSAAWTNLLRSQNTDGLYYNEGSTAVTTYWNNATTYTMDNFGELGRCTAHGWTSGPAEYIFTLPGLPYHTSIRYRACVHLVDSLDNETSYVDFTNSAGTYERYFTWTKNYPTDPVLSFTKAGASATWSGNKTYTYSPWPGTPQVEGYYILDSGRYEHTADSFSARHYMGADQDVSDEAMYITHVQLYLYN
jgi:hypothetical protein